MKFTQKHKDILLGWGFKEEDLWQLEEATKRANTTYTLSSKKNPIPERKISEKECIDLLGIETFLSGIGRSAFHWSAVREAEAHNGLYVYFDSSKLFR